MSLDPSHRTRLATAVTPCPPKATTDRLMERRSILASCPWRSCGSTIRASRASGNGADMQDPAATRGRALAATWRSMKELWWIRHGETDWNLALRIQGSSDVELNETGVAQARALAPRLEKVAFDAVYASDLSRAHRTAMLASSGAKIRTDPRLRELSYGMLEGARWADLSDEQSATARHWQEDPRRRRLPGGGESYDDLAARVAAFVADLPAEGRFAAFSHGGTIRGALYTILGHPNGSTWRLAIDNCSVTRLRFDERGVTILGLNEGALGAS